MRRPPPAVPVPPAPEQGFTLVEVLVSLALFALIALAGFALVNAVLEVQNRTDGRLEALARLQRAMYLLDSDLQQIAGLPQLAPAGIRFRRHGGSGTVEVRYDLAGATLRRAVGDGAPRAMLEGIAGATLRFHLTDGNWVRVLPDPRMGLYPDAVELVVRVSTPPGLPGGSIRRVVPLPGL